MIKSLVVTVVFDLVKGKVPSFLALPAGAIGKRFFRRMIRQPAGNRPDRSKRKAVPMLTTSIGRLFVLMGHRHDAPPIQRELTAMRAAAKPNRKTASGADGPRSTVARTVIANEFSRYRTTIHQPTMNYSPRNKSARARGVLQWLEVGRCNGYGPEFVRARASRHSATPAGTPRIPSQANARHHGRICAEGGGVMSTRQRCRRFRR